MDYVTRYLILAFRRRYVNNATYLIVFYVTKRLYFVERLSKALRSLKVIMGSGKCRPKWISNEFGLFFYWYFMLSIGGANNKDYSIAVMWGIVSVCVGKWLGKPIKLWSDAQRMCCTLGYQLLLILSSYWNIKPKIRSIFVLVQRKAQNNKI